MQQQQWIVTASIGGSELYFRKIQYTVCIVLLIGKYLETLCKYIESSRRCRAFRGSLARVAVPVPRPLTPAHIITQDTTNARERPRTPSRSLGERSLARSRYCTSYPTRSGSHGFSRAKNKEEKVNHVRIVPSAVAPHNNSETSAARVSCDHPVTLPPMTSRP